MAEMYTTLVARVRETYPDCTTTLALSNLNLIVRQLCRTIPLYRTSADVTLTADDPSYTLSDTVGQIDTVFYVTSATQRTQLEYVALDELNQDDSNFRLRDSGTPSRYYLTQTASSAPAGALEIGLDCPPDTTTSGGYPKLTIYYSEIPSADFSGSDSSPQALERPNVLVYGANMLYAEFRKMWDDVGAWKALFDAEHSRQWNHVNHRSRFDPPRWVPASVRRVRSRV